MKKRGKGKLDRIKIDHNKKLLFFIVVLFVVLVFLVVSLKQNEENLPFDECTKDSDCLKQQITCCPCNMGGEEKCTTNQGVEDYAGRLKSCPEDLVCIALENCKIDTCICENNKCQAVNLSQ